MADILRRIERIGLRLDGLHVSQRIVSSDAGSVRVVFGGRLQGEYLVRDGHVSVLSIGPYEIPVAGRRASDVASEIQLLHEVRGSVA